MNDFHQNGTPYPNTIVEAFRRASDWEIDNPTKRPPPKTSKTSVSYHADVKGGRGRGSRNHHKGHEEAKLTCYFCEEQGHIMKNCEKYWNAKSTACNSAPVITNESKHVATCLSVSIDKSIFKEMQLHIPKYELLENKPTGPNDILLDSQSQDHIFQNKLLLNDVGTTSEAMIVRGQVEGAEFSTNQAGKLLSIKRKVYVSEKASANLLSLSQVEKECNVQFISGLFRVTLPDNSTMIFRNINNLYICNYPCDIIPSSPTSQLDTFSFFARKDSHEQANLLIRKLGYPSDRSVIKALQSGSIHNSPCVSNDIYSMRKARGPSIPVLKEKSTNRGIFLPRTEIFQPLISKNQELFIDVMHCEGLYFFISVARPLDLTLSTRIQSLKSSQVKKALKNQVNLMKAKSFQINTIHSDGGFRSINEFILSFGIQHQMCAAGVHVSIVERKIRVIKERMRTILFSLPFLLPNSLLPYLVTFVTRTINMITTTNSENNVAPFENFMARKINYNIDLRIFFGMYCQVLTAEINNSMQQRTTGAIALTQTNSGNGTAIFYDLNTKKIIHRDKWSELPMPQDAIDRINSIAMQEKVQPTKNPVVNIGLEQRDANIIPIEEDNPEVLLPVQNVTMEPDQSIIEIDQAIDTSNDSDDQDSDYVPSDQEDEDFEADFEETTDALNEDVKEYDVEEDPTIPIIPVSQSDAAPESIIRSSKPKARTKIS